MFVYVCSVSEILKLLREYESQAKSFEMHGFEATPRALESLSLGCGTNLQVTSIQSDSDALVYVFNSRI